MYARKIVEIFGREYVTDNSQTLKVILVLLKELGVEVVGEK